MISVAFMGSISCEKLKLKHKAIPRKTVVVLIDLSGSTRNLRNMYLDNFRTVLSTITHGDAIAVARITESSITEPEIPKKRNCPNLFLGTKWEIPPIILF